MSMSGRDSDDEPRDTKREDLTGDEVLDRRLSPLRGWTREAMLHALVGFSKAYGRWPKPEEWTLGTPEHPRRDTVEREFGSWANALKKAQETAD
jgi:hypothetical protein